MNGRKKHPGRKERGRGEGKRKKAHKILKEQERLDYGGYGGACLNV